MQAQNKRRDPIVCSECGLPIAREDDLVVAMWDFGLEPFELTGSN